MKEKNDSKKDYLKFRQVQSTSTQLRIDKIIEKELIKRYNSKYGFFLKIKDKLFGLPKGFNKIKK